MHPAGEDTPESACIVWLSRITTHQKNALAHSDAKTRVAPTKHGKPKGELVTLIL